MNVRNTSGTVYIKAIRRQNKKKIIKLTFTLFRLLARMSFLILRALVFLPYNTSLSEPIADVISHTLILSLSLSLLSSSLSLPFAKKLSFSRDGIVTRGRHRVTVEWKQGESPFLETSSASFSFLVDRLRSDRL